MQGPLRDGNLLEVFAPLAAELSNRLSSHRLNSRRDEARDECFFFLEDPQLAKSAAHSPTNFI